MQETLLRKLHEYVRDNNPDLLLTLQEENRLTAYLNESVASVDSLIHQLAADNQPPSVIEEACMDELTKPLRPSRYSYIKSILEEEFPVDFERMLNSNVLTTELINMITACDEVFDEFAFSEATEGNRYLRYAVTGAVYEYLKREA